jgi:hypothetical protein
VPARRGSTSRRSTSSRPAACWSASAASRPRSSRGSRDADLWDAARKLAWAPAGTSVVRAAVGPRGVAALDPGLDGVARRYSSGAAAAWIAWPPDRPLEALDALLRDVGAGATRLTGPPGPVLLGATTGGAFAERVRRGLDPDGRFAGSARRFVPVRKVAAA